ncbi:MAG: VanZ family protein [Pseudomonadales bacterium]
MAALFQIGFWIPFAFSTYFALVPDPPEYPVFQVSDVILHGAAFTYLTFAFALAQYENYDPRRLYVRSFVLMLAYGLLIEIAQSFVPERSAELKDLFVDVLGIGLGILMTVYFAGPLRQLAARLLVRR